LQTACKKALAGQIGAALAGAGARGGACGGVAVGAAGRFARRRRMGGSWVAQKAVSANTFCPENAYSNFRAAQKSGAIPADSTHNRTSQMSRQMSRIGNLFISGGEAAEKLNPLEITPLTAKSRFVPLGSLFVVVSWLHLIPLPRGEGGGPTNLKSQFQNSKPRIPHPASFCSHLGLGPTRSLVRVL